MHIQVQYLLYITVDAICHVNTECMISVYFAVYYNFLKGIYIAYFCVNVLFYAMHLVCFVFVLFCLGILRSQPVCYA